MAAVLSLGGTAMASALLPTTPACELLTEAEVSALLGSPATQEGGNGTPIADCYWTADMGVGLQVQLSYPEMFTPSGRSAAIQFDEYAASIKNIVKLEMIEGLGERAALYRNSEHPSAFHVMMAVNGYFIEMTVYEGDRDRIVVAMRAAAGRVPKS
ncbi:MAG: hypothetical protein QM698_12370 [Micropepsaceae bacterium]